MPTSAERLHQVTTKLNRAKKHFADLERMHKEYVHSRPIEVKGNDWRSWVKSIKEPDADFATVIGDILQNLVSALDHLAYQLVCVGKTCEGPFNYVYFPIAGSEADYNQQKFRKLNGAKAEAIDAIDQIKPFKGGNDVLWRLRELNNIDKHRLLITVGGAYNSINLGTALADVMGNMMQSMVLSRESGQGIISLNLSGPVDEQFMPEKIDFSMGVKHKQFPLTVGTELCSGIKCKPEDFTFYLAFGEPGFDDGTPIMELLGEMTNQVEQIIFDFESLLS